MVQELGPVSLLDERDFREQQRQERTGSKGGRQGSGRMKQRHGGEEGGTGGGRIERENRGVTRRGRRARHCR